MIILSATPLKLTANNVLHLVCGQDESNPQVQEAIVQVSCQTKQIARVGEHFLADFRFNHFDTVILHTCSEQNLATYTKKIATAQTLRRFKSFLYGKRLVVYGNAIKALGPRLIRIPLALEELAHGVKTSNVVSLDQQALGLFNFNLDLHADAIKKNPRYIQRLQKLPEKVVIFDGSGVLIFDDQKVTVKYGKVYTLKDSQLVPVTISSPKVKARSQAEAKKIVQESKEERLAEYKPHSTGDQPDANTQTSN